MSCNDFRSVFTKNGITLEKHMNDSSFLHFYFTTKYNEDRDIIQIAKDYEFYNVLKRVNPSIIVNLTYEETALDRIVIIEARIQNDDGYDTDDTDDTDNTDNNDDVFILHGPNNVTVINDSHVKINYNPETVVEYGNDYTFIIEIIKDKKEMIQGNLFLRINRSINIIKENMLLDTLQEVLYNLKMYLEEK